MDFLIISSLRANISVGIILIKPTIFATIFSQIFQILNFNRLINHTFINQLKQYLCNRFMKRGEYDVLNLNRSRTKNIKSLFLSQHLNSEDIV